MRNPLKRKVPSPTRRQRQISEPPAPARSFSYHGRRSEQAANSGRQPQRDAVTERTRSRLKSYWLQRFGTLIMLAVLAVSAVNIQNLTTDARIIPLTSGNNLLRDQSVYQAAANRILNKSPFNRSKLTIQTSNLSKQFTNQFPELASANITIPLLAHRPIIYIEPARPALILSASSGSYVISSQGRAIAPSSQISSSLQSRLPSVGDQGGVQLAPNVAALTSENVHFIEVIVAQLAAKNYKTTTMTLPAAAGELDVQLADQPYSIKFNLQSNNPREQVGTFLATISEVKRKNITPTRYIDVRVEGRAYYL